MDINQAKDGGVIHYRIPVDELRTDRVGKVLIDSDGWPQFRNARDKKVHLAQMQRLCSNCRIGGYLPEAKFTTNILLQWGDIPVTRFGEAASVIPQNTGRAINQGMLQVLAHSQIYENLGSASKDDFAKFLNQYKAVSLEIIDYHARYSQYVSSTLELGDSAKVRGALKSSFRSAGMLGRTIFSGMVKANIALMMKTGLLESGMSKGFSVRDLPEMPRYHSSNSVLPKALADHPHLSNHIADIVHPSFPHPSGLGVICGK